MITRISIENLGCFDDGPYVIDFDRLTVFVGANNSGKSTVFKGLNLVRRMALTAGQLQWDLPNYYSLHSFQESVYAHQQNRTMRIITQYRNNGNQLTSRLAIQGNNIVENKVEEQGTVIGQISHPTHRDCASSVWYVSPNRMVIPHQIRLGQPADETQGLTPTGSNIIDFLVQRYTSQDTNWDYAQRWLQRIDPQMTSLKTPVLSNVGTAVTRRNDQSTETDINLNLQGSGIQNAATIIAAVVFSPDNATIIIEEPENFLNYGSVESLIDLFNELIANTGKQIIITTHSWDILTTYTNDIAPGLTRTGNHVVTNPANFKLITFQLQPSQQKIQQYQIQGKNIGTVWNDIKALWEPN